MAITTPGAVDYHLTSQNASRALSINAVTQPVTLMCWLNATWNSGTRYSMFGTYNTPTTGGTAIQIGASLGNGNVDCWTWGGTVLVGSAGGSGALPTNNAWTHIAYTYDTTTHRLYINGQACNTATTAQLAGTITAVYCNGYPGGGAAETSTFSVEDSSYFLRVLSPQEILTAYTTTGDRDGLWYGNAASYLFDEGTTGSTASQVTDYTGHLNNLTPIGTATGVNFTYSQSYITNDLRPVQG